MSFIIVVVPEEMPLPCIEILGDLSSGQHAVILFKFLTVRCHSLYEMELSLQVFSFLFHRWNRDSCVQQMLPGVSRQGHWIYVSPSTLTWGSRQPHPATQKRLKIKRFGPSSQLCKQTTWRPHLVSLAGKFWGQIAYPGYKTKR